MSPMTPPFWNYINNFQHWFDHHRVEAYGGLAALFAIGLGVKALQRRHRRDTLVSHGSARWPTAKEVFAYGLSQAHGVVVGEYHGVVLLDDSQRHVLLLAPTGCHAPGSEILMADGHVKKVEDIQVGDQVMGPDSAPRTVLSLHRGTSAMARIVPTKGEPFVVNLDHILAVKRTSDGTTFGGRVTMISVRDWLRASKTYQHIHKLYRVPVTFPAVRTLPIPPYVLGALLGDGRLSRTPQITKPDPELREAIATLIRPMAMKIGKVRIMGSGCPVYGLCLQYRSSHGYAVNPLGQALEELGLLHKTA